MHAKYWVWVGAILIVISGGCSGTDHRRTSIPAETGTEALGEIIEDANLGRFVDGWDSKTAQFPTLSTRIYDFSEPSCVTFKHALDSAEELRSNTLTGTGAWEARIRNSNGIGYVQVSLSTLKQTVDANAYVTAFGEVNGADDDARCTEATTSGGVQLVVSEREPSTDAPNAGAARSSVARSADGRNSTILETYAWSRSNVAVTVQIAIDLPLANTMDISELLDALDGSITAYLGQ
ncbi:MAG: hypothetical protein AB7N24_11340 [Dehalococcoidia bacterium]